MKTISNCLSADLLRELLLGRGDPALVSAWEEHYLNCSICSERAAQIQAEDDELVKAFRRVAQNDDTPQPPIVETLVSVFRRVSNNSATQSWNQSPSGSPQEKTDNFLAPPKKPDEIGSLGPYAIHEVLGSGGMGVVYRGYDPNLQRVIAIKVIRADQHADPSMRERFLQEARSAAAIENDHIVTVYSVEVHDGISCITMPILQGMSLESKLRTSRLPLPIPEVLRLGREIATGLAAAHERGLIHRDIKPANLWLESPNDRVKILDFGLALCLELAQESACFAGTPGFMSPEQANGLAMDTRTDLFSLGCVLYYAASGAAPFVADSPMSSIIKTIAKELPPIRSQNPSIPQPLGELIDRLLAKEPSQRHDSADAVLQALKAIEAGIAAESHRRSRRRWMAGIATAMLLSGVGVAFGFLSNQPKPVEVMFSGDDDVGALILTQNGVDYPLDLKGTPSKMLPPGDYNVKLANPVAKRELIPNSFLLLPKEPKSVRFSVVGEMASHRMHTQSVTGVAVIGNAGSFSVLSSSQDRTISTWKPSSTEPVKFVKLESPALCLAATADGSLVATAGGNKNSPFDLNVHLLNGQTLQRRGQPLSEHTRRINAVAVSSNGQMVISAAKTELRLWTVATSTCAVLEGHGDEAMITAIAFDPTRMQALTGDDKGTAILWDVAEAKPLRKFIAQSVGSMGELKALAFTPNGFVTTGDDGVIRVWDRQTFKSRELLSLPKAVNTLAVSRDGNRLLAGCEDGRLRLWSLPEGQLLSELVGHTAPIRGVAFTPDERAAVSGGDDRTVRLWRLPH